MKLHSLAFAVVLIVTFTTTASASVIVSATDATASSTFGGIGSPVDIQHTIDQSGLSITYNSGVTDFDTYLSLAPIHTFVAEQFEWFGNISSSTAVITYDLGSVLSIDRLVLWGEESSGFGTANILSSIDGVTFNLLTTINPLANPLLNDYAAEVFSLNSTVSGRYFRLDLSNCPQPNGNANFQGCSLGEIAFSSVSAVPLPPIAPLFGIGLAMIGFIGQRRKS